MLPTIKEIPKHEHNKFGCFIVSILYKMVLTTIADVTLEVTVWGAKKIYGLGYWFVWGTPKTETELLLEKQNETIQMLHKDLTTINERLRKIEENQHETPQTLQTPIRDDEPIEIFSTDIPQKIEIIKTDNK